MVNALKNNYPFIGGKSDDITIVLGEIVKRKVSEDFKTEEV